MQQTVGLALCTASGVGKTFATFSFRHGARSIGAPFERVCAYVGLNHAPHREEIHLGREE